MVRYWLIILVAGFAASAQASPITRNATLTDRWDVTAPKGEVRKISFTTDEATWMSIDVSPDGDWIALDVLGHVYRISLAGGRAELLTGGSGIALNYQPQISPDGQQIAFISDRSGQEGLWIMGEGGGDPHLIFVDPESRIRAPRWAPDGDSIVAVRQRRTPYMGFHRVQTEIWRFPLDGSAPEALVADEKAQSHAPAISEDGRYLYFHDSFYIGLMIGTYNGHSLKRMDLQTGDIEPIGEQPPAEILADALPPDAYDASRYNAGGVPDWNARIAPEPSPDGRYLAFARRSPEGKISWRGHQFGPSTALWVRDLQSGVERKVMDPITLDLSTGHARFSADRILPGYSWTPDGKSIVITEGGKIRLLDAATGQITTIPFEVSVNRTISGLVRGQASIPDENFPVSFLQWPSTSPDKEHLAFSGAGRIWIQDTAQDEPRPLTAHVPGKQQLSPAWSPDGQTIAYTDWDDQGRGHLWTAPAQGGTPTQLTQIAGEYIYPLWSDDGESVFVIANPVSSKNSSSSRNPLDPNNSVVNRWNRAGQWRLMKFPVRGGEPSTITYANRGSQLDIPRPHRAPGGRIAFEHRETDFVSIRSVETDGTNPRDHVRFKTIPNGPSYPAPRPIMSPDGAWVAFENARAGFVAPLPAEGPPPTIDANPNVENPAFRRIDTLGAIYMNWSGPNIVEYFDGAVHVKADARRNFEPHRQKIDLTLPTDAPVGTVAFVNARIFLIDDDTVIERGDVVIQRNRISCIGTCSKTGVDKIFDAEGKTIIPGLIDMHEHASLETGSVIPQHRPGNTLPLAYGVTTIYDPAQESPSALTNKMLVDSGAIVGPRQYGSLEIISSFRGWGEQLQIRKYEDAVENVERRAAWGARQLKNYTQDRRDQSQMLIHAARSNGGVSITGEGGYLAFALAQVMDGQTAFEHQIYPIPVYKDVTQFIARSETAYSPTVNVTGHWRGAEKYFRGPAALENDEKYSRFVPPQILGTSTASADDPPIENYSFPISAEGVADIIRGGGYATIGEHGQQYGIGSHWEIWAYSEALDPFEALRMATLFGARSLGLEKDLGSVKVGKIADLVILNSDPRTDIRNTSDIEWVVKNGVVYHAGTLDEVWPQHRPYQHGPDGEGWDQ